LNLSYLCGLLTMVRRLNHDDPGYATPSSAEDKLDEESVMKQR